MANPDLPVGALEKPRKGERLRMAKATLDKASRALTTLYAKVYKRDGYQCVVCRRPVVVGSPNELKRAHPHHIVFRSSTKLPKTEKHTTANVCTLCPMCHGDVHDRKLFISGNADEQLDIRSVAS
jgi:HNH endonuclease